MINRDANRVGQKKSFCIEKILKILVAYKKISNAGWSLHSKQPYVQVFIAVERKFTRLFSVIDILHDNRW